MLQKLRVAVLTGGPSSEHDVSVSSGKMVLKFLGKKRYVPHEVRVHRNGAWQFLPHTKRYANAAALQKLKQRFDVVFVALHGKFGEDGVVQSMLDGINLPYTGSGVAASAVAMDKVLSNAIFAARGLVVPAYQMLHSPKAVRCSLPFPIVVKPVRGGSSVGVTIVRNRTQLKSAVRIAFREDDRVMLQRCIRGRELTCGVLEKHGQPFALTPTEITPRIASFFDYNAKYQEGGSEELTPPRLSALWIRKVQRAALLAHTALGCRGMSRTDFIFDGRKLYTIELNTIPGMTHTSLLPQQAVHDQIALPTMCDLIVRAALHR